MNKSLQLLLTLMLMMLGCAKPADDSTPAGFIGSGGQFANFFSGYDSTTEKFTEVCVTSADPRFVIRDTIFEDAKLVDFRRTGADGELSIDDGVSVRRVLAKLNGEGKLSLGGGSIAGNGNLAFAIKAAETEYNRSFVFHTTAHEDMVMNLENLALTGTGMLYADQASPYRGDVRLVCGDEFVTEITRGISLTVTVKFNFLTREDAAELSGDLSVGTSSPHIKLDQQATSRAAAARTKVEIFAKQIGGNPQDLYNILPDEAPVCDLDDLTDCEAILDNLYNYLNDFIHQRSASASTYTPFTYKTESYSNYLNTRSLAGVDGVRTSSRQQNQTSLRELQSQMVKWLLARDRIGFLMGEVPAEKVPSLEQLKKKIDQGVKEMSGMIMTCEVSGESCAEQAGRLLRQLSDPALLGYDGEQLWQK